MTDRIALDLKDAVRRLGATPGFTVAALAMLAIGIGGSSVIFTAVDAFALRERPFLRPHELVFVYQDSDEGQPSSNSYPTYLDVKGHTDLFSGVGAVMPEGTATLASDVGDAVQLPVEYATSSYFPVLGIHPALGRWFAPEEDLDGAAPVAVLTYSAWQRRFGGDPAIVGRAITLSGVNVTIVGVGPSTFNGFVPGLASDAWLSISALGPVGGVFRARTLTRREDHWFQIVARLAPGRSRGEAQAAMSFLAERTAREFPETDRGRKITVLDPSEVRVHPEIDPMLYPASGAPLVLAALVLTLVCSNLANMTLARGAARRRDIAVRLAIGATQAQVVRSLTLESVLLALTGGAAGLLLAWWAVELLGSWRAPLVDVAPTLSLDARVIAFSIGLSLATGIAFGLLPALRASRTELRQAIGGDVGRAVRVRDVRGALIALQIAIGIVLLIGGTLLMRTMVHALRIDPGFDVARLAMVSVDAGQAGLPPQLAPQLLLDLRDRVSGIAGVEGAALTTRAPVTRFGPSTSLVLDERALAAPDGSRSAEVRFASITPGYFNVAGIPIVHGRDFEDADNVTGAPVAIVSRAMAQRFWGTSDVLGRRYRHEGSQVWITIVGVAGDVPIQALAEVPAAFVYRPAAQRRSPMAIVIIRTAGDPAAVLPLVRQELRALNPRAPVLLAATMSDYVARSLALQRLVGTVIGWAAALAVVLACLGVYSVVAFTVARRRTEMGLRMALGATGHQVTTLGPRRDVAPGRGGCRRRARRRRVGEPGPERAPHRRQPARRADVRGRRSGRGSVGTTDHVDPGPSGGVRQPGSRAARGVGGLTRGQARVESETPR